MILGMVARRFRDKLVFDDVCVREGGPAQKGGGPKGGGPKVGGPT